MSLDDFYQYWRLWRRHFPRLSYGKAYQVGGCKALLIGLTVVAGVVQAVLRTWGYPALLAVDPEVL